MTELKPTHRSEHRYSSRAILVLAVGRSDICSVSIKRIKNEFTGVLTGKGLEWGGSVIRPEATGYGAVYFAQEMLSTKNESLEGKTCAVSGSGNVAQFTTQKVTELGGRVVTLSDSAGFIYDPNGIDAEKLAWVMELKNIRRGRISEYAEEFGCEYHEGKRPWSVFRAMLHSLQQPKMRSTKMMLKHL